MCFFFLYTCFSLVAGYERLMCHICDDNQKNSITSMKFYFLIRLQHVFRHLREECADWKYSDTITECHQCDMDTNTARRRNGLQYKLTCFSTTFISSYITKRHIIHIYTAECRTDEDVSCHGSSSSSPFSNFGVDFQQWSSSGICCQTTSVSGFTQN